MNISIPIDAKPDSILPIAEISNAVRGKPGNVFIVGSETALNRLYVEACVVKSDVMAKDPHAEFRTVFAFFQQCEFPELFTGFVGSKRTEPVFVGTV